MREATTLIHGDMHLGNMVFDAANEGALITTLESKVDPLTQRNRGVRQELHALSRPRLEGAPPLFMYAALWN